MNEGDAVAKTKLEKPVGELPKEQQEKPSGELSKKQQKQASGEPPKGQLKETSSGPRPQTALKERDKVPLRSLVSKYIIIFFGALIAAIGLETFLIPNEVIDGGVVGISIMGEAVFGYPMGLFLVVLNLPFVLLGYKQIGKSFAIATIFAIIVLSLWSYILDPYLGTVTEDLFLAAIFGGIIDGLGVGLIIRAGGSLDGTEMVAIILDKKTAFSVGEVVMFFNLFILGSAGFLFGWNKAMYSLVAYFVIAKMIDVVIKGLDESYAVFIVTSQHVRMAEVLMARLGRGVTLLHGEGAYSGAERKVLYAVVTRLEIQKLKEIVLEEDASAFVTINPVNDIIGGSFKKRAIH